MLYGGARNVVGTRWQVADAQAARLAERFYVHLRSLAPPEALAAAQRDLLAGAEGDPRAWAAYEVSGDGRRVGG
jgi:CHAT domain-containing protein